MLMLKAMPERLRFGAPFSSRMPPTKATITYITLPILSQQWHQAYWHTDWLFQNCQTDCIVDLIKIRLRTFFMAENLNDLLSVHHFLHKPFCTGNGYLLLKEITGGMAADITGHHKRHDHHAARRLPAPAKCCNKP